MGPYAANSQPKFCPDKSLKQLREKHNPASQPPWQDHKSILIRILQRRKCPARNRRGSCPLNSSRNRHKLACLGLTIETFRIALIRIRILNLGPRERSESANPGRNDDATMTISLSQTDTAIKAGISLRRVGVAALLHSFYASTV